MCKSFAYSSILAFLLLMSSALAFEVYNNTDSAIYAQGDGFFGNFPFGVIQPKTYSKPWEPSSLNLPAQVYVSWSNGSNCIVNNNTSTQQNYRHGYVRVDGSCAQGFTALTPNLDGHNSKD